MKEQFTENLERSMDNLYKGGAFLTAGNREKYNTMTISWGSIGYIWKKPVFMVLVRESRYTNEFLKKGDYYTVSIPYDGRMKSALNICGTKSGRDINKEKEANIKFVTSKRNEAPIIENCNKYYECKIIAKQELNLGLVNDDIIKNFYSNNDGNHILYFGEILEEYEM